MSLETVARADDSTRETAPRAARLALGGAVAALFGAAGLLWFTQGSRVFIDALAAGFAWCF